MWIRSLTKKRDRRCERPVAFCGAKGSARGWREGAGHDDQDCGQDDEGRPGDLKMYHDGYKERIEALITSKMKGEVAQVKEEKPKKPAAKSMMEMLRETAESLK